MIPVESAIIAVAVDLLDSLADGTMEIDDKRELMEATASLLNSAVVEANGLRLMLRAGKPRLRLVQ